jgi:DNA processing protein
MSCTELQLRIALTMIPDIGAVTARKLISHLGSVSAIFHQSPERLMQIRGIGPRLSSAITSSRLLEEARREEEFIHKHDIRVSYYQDPEYPRRLKECNDHPVLLYSHGKPCLNAERILSVVGTRRASCYGKEVCRELIRGIAEMYGDVVIVSGLAYGIDVAAHRAALENGLDTIAVLGHGLRTIYPHVHRETAKKIIRQGALVTDFHSETRPEKNNFLRRNRIIAGLSDATLVVESGEKGGALITADLADSYDRYVMAVPGRIDDPRSKGCNNLIKDHLAALVTSPSDIAYLLNWEERPSPRKQPLVQESALDPREKKVLAMISGSPEITPEVLSHQTNIPIHTMLSMLVEMELKGWISLQPGNRYRLSTRPLWNSSN